jgi:hypothetical protein
VSSRAFSEAQPFAMESLPGKGRTLSWRTQALGGRTSLARLTAPHQKAICHASVRVTVYDSRTAMLHLLSQDSEKLRYYRNDTQRPLTDMDGMVIREAPA